MPPGHPSAIQSSGSRLQATENAPDASPDSTNLPRPSGPLRRFVRDEQASFGHAFEGVWYCWRTQRHLRIHALVAALAIGAGVALRISAAEWAAIVVLITLVTALELLNTVIEVVVDLVTPDYHPAAKVAKDVAAGAVLVAAIGAVATAAVIFVPRVWRLLS
jgi:diacylglycerol kinase (ATP)